MFEAPPDPPIGVRRFEDGVMWLPKRHPKIEKFMDKYYLRWPNELKWSYKEDSDLNDLKNKYIDSEIGFIIGKGPSLDTLTATHFINDKPIICCNESIHKIESLGLDNPLIVVQQDFALKGRCVPKNVDNVLHLANHQAKGYTTNKKARAYLPALFGLNGNSLTVEMAITLASWFGLEHCYLYGFDSVLGNYDYAKAIGMASDHDGLKKTRFKSHKQRIIDVAARKRINITFLGTSEPFSGTLQHMPNNQIEHHEV
jgi:hypothetical protein